MRRCGKVCSNVLYWFYQISDTVSKNNIDVAAYYDGYTGIGILFIWSASLSASSSDFPTKSALSVLDVLPVGKALTAG